MALIILRLFLSFEVVLFLGYPMTAALDEAIRKLDPARESHFFQDHTSNYYLQIASEGSQQFLGKCAGKLISIEELKLLETNISSLIRQLLPDCTLQHKSILFAYTTRGSN